MNKLKTALALALLATGLSACSIFEDRTPEFINVRMDGPAGELVTVVYSKQFVAGVDEVGITRVQVFGADTVVHSLPVDTVIDVRLERRLFLQAAPPVLDSVDVSVEIDVDGRSLYDRSGKIFLSTPWLFLYQFNARSTDAIEVII